MKKSVMGDGKREKNGKREKTIFDYLTHRSFIFVQILII